MVRLRGARAADRSMAAVMITAELLGALATAYGLLGASSTLLMGRKMMIARSSAGVSAGFLGTYAGGYLTWLLYGISIGSMPLILVDSIGILCALATLAIMRRV